MDFPLCLSTYFLFEKNVVEVATVAMRDQVVADYGDFFGKNCTDVEIELDHFVKVISRCGVWGVWSHWRFIFTSIVRNLCLASPSCRELLVQRPLTVHTAGYITRILND